METSYRKLFAISVTHEHFGGRGCPDLTIEPTAAAAQVMRGYRMRLRPETGGAAVYIWAKYLHADALPKEPLVFTLNVRDPRFYQYTMLDRAASPNATVAVFDNLHIFRGQIQESAMLLAKPGEVKLTPVTGGGGATASLLDRPGAAVFGLVTIHLGQAASPPVPTAMKAFADGKPQEPRFIVPLLARQARWRYLIAGAVEGDRIEASDLAASKAIVFGDPAAIEIAGRKAVALETKQAFPVLSDPRGAYAAKLVSSNGDERILPLPSVASLRADASGDGMVAEMVALAHRVS